MERNQVTARRFFELIPDDPETAIRLLDPQVVWTIIGDTPLSGTHRGLETLTRDVFVPFRELVEDVKLVVDEVFGEGERVALLAHGEGRARTGRPYPNRYAFIMRVRDGRIREVVEYMDTALVETALYGRRVVED